MSELNNSEKTKASASFNMKLPEKWAEVLQNQEKVAQVWGGKVSFRDFFHIGEREMRGMVNVAYFLYEQGHYEDAIKIFKGLVAIDPKKAYLRTALGAICLCQHKFDEALRHCNDALNIDSNENAALVNRAEIYIRRGQLVEAEKDLEAFLGLDVDKKSPMAIRAKALAASIKRRLEQKKVTSKPANLPNSEPNSGQKSFLSKWLRR